METNHPPDATQVLEMALKAPPDQRAQIVRELCGTDDALHQEVLSLLRVAERAGGFLETPAVLAMTTGMSHESEWAGLGAGDAVGPYRIVRRVGTGGMGDVYLAEQTEPIRRRVAMKIVKPGMDTRAVLARFRQERRTLSLIEHPGVARVYDAGSTERGLPYFIMEFVDGVPLTAYCNEHDLPVAERVSLFQQVCGAVHFAHQKGVIHRDLKPSNVLVELAEGSPRAKVIDFGIAKALEDDASEATLVTGAGQFIGTPEYMAPEQASGGADVRSDVFSLGVMLYELVTGTLPVDRDRVRRMTGKELGAYLVTTTPKRPSTALAERRSVVDAVAPMGTLPRELDWILMKCLERDPARRYASVAALSEDLSRMLAHEPVSAGPPSRAYRASKFIRRNRAAVAGACIVALALIGGTVAASIGFVRARDSQQKAEAAALHAEKVNDFLERMLLTIRPETARGMDTALLRMMAEEAEAAMGTDLADVPEAEADISLTLARIYGATSDWERSVTLATRARDLYSVLKGPDDSDTIASMDWLSSGLDALGRVDEAVKMSEDAYQRSLRSYGPDDPQTLTTMNNLGNLYMAVFRLDDADRLITESYEKQREIFGNEDENTLSVLSNLASLRDRQGRTEESLELLTTCVEARLRSNGEDHPKTIATMNNLAATLQNLERFDEAEPWLIRVIALSEQVNGPDHAMTLTALNNLGSQYKSTGRLEEAVPIFERAIAGLERRSGPDAFETLATKRNLGEVLGMMGRVEESEGLLRDVVERARRALVPEHPLNAIAPVVLSIGLSRQGRVAEAYQMLDETWDLIGELPPPGNAARAEVLRGLVFLSDTLGFQAENERWQQLFDEATSD